MWNIPPYSYQRVHLLPFAKKPAFTQYQVLPVPSFLFPLPFPFPFLPFFTCSFSPVLDRAGKFGSNRKRACSKGESFIVRMAFPLSSPFPPPCRTNPSIHPCHPKSKPVPPTLLNPHSQNLSLHHRAFPWDFPNKALQNLSTHIQMHVCIQKQHKKRP